MDGGLMLGHGHSSGSVVAHSSSAANKDDFWTPELEVKLAEKIRSFPCLYDSTHSDWKNKPYRQDLWDMISAEMNATVEQCRKKYKGLRDKAVREYRLGKESKWPAAESMRFVLPLAKIRHDNKKPSKSGSSGTYEDSNNYGFDSGSFDVDDNDQDEAEAYNNARSAGLIPGTSIPNIVPPIVQPQHTPGIPLFNGFNHLALPNYGADRSGGSSSKRKYEVDEAYHHQYGDYFNQAKNMRLPSSSKSSIIHPITRPQPLPVSNGFNFNLNHLSSSVNGGHNQQTPSYKPPEANGNGNSSSSRKSSSASSSQKHGSSYHFGQYIASALDTLSSDGAIDAKQKIQDILFKAQLKHVGHVHKSGSSGRRSEGTHPVVVFDEATGREQVMEIEKDNLSHHAKN